MIWYIESLFYTNYVCIVEANYLLNRKFELSNKVSNWFMNSCAVNGCQFIPEDTDDGVCPSHTSEYQCSECRESMIYRVSIVIGLCVYCRDAFNDPKQKIWFRFHLILMSKCVVDGCICQPLWPEDVVCEYHWTYYDCMRCKCIISRKISIETGICMSCRLMMWLKLKIWYTFPKQTMCKCIIQECTRITTSYELACLGCYKKYSCSYCDALMTTKLSIDFGVCSYCRVDRFHKQKIWFWLLFKAK